MKKQPDVRVDKASARSAAAQAYDPKTLEDRMALLERRLARSESARAQAEALLEHKSRVLAYSNEELQARKDELSESLELRSRQLIDAQRVAGFATMTYDVVTRRMEVSPHINRMFGLSERQKVESYRTLLRCADPRDRVRLLDWLFGKVLANRKTKPQSEYKIQFRCRGGLRRRSDRHLKVMAQFQRDERNRSRMLLVTIQDVTREILAAKQAANLRTRERRRLTELERLNTELEAAREGAEQASRAKSRFLAMMSHDIRTPLNGIIGMLALTEEDGLTAEQVQTLSLVRSSGEQLRILLDDIIDLARAEAGQLKLHRGPVPLKNLLADTVGFWRYLAADKGLTLDLAIGPDLPQWIEADGSRLRQLLDNLISNAIKYTEQGGVIVRASGQRDRLGIDVVDTGIGVPSDRASHLFQDFTQLHLTGNAEGGAGLGLAICRRIIEVKGGEIGYVPCNGGSKFWFEIPLKTISEPARSAAVPIEVLRTAAGLRPKVLVAEDLATNRIVVSGHLARLGCDVVMAENGQQAVDLARQHRFDLVLMDVAMPVLDGPAATRQIRLLDHPNADVGIIALTALAMDDELKPMWDAGADSSASKPICLADLRAVMAEVMQRPKIHRGSNPA